MIRKSLLLICAAMTSASSFAQNQAPMVLQFDKPATYFEESLPIGNGKIGALVYGGTDDNIIYLNDITLRVPTHSIISHWAHFTSKT